MNYLSRLTANLKGKSPKGALILFEIYEAIQNKWILSYGLVFFLFSSFFINFNTYEIHRIFISMLNLILLITPLFSLFLGYISFSESLSFMGILVANPISRKDIFWGKLLGLSLALNISFFLGVFLSAIFWIHILDNVFYLVMLLLFACILNYIFIAIAFLISNVIYKKESVIGALLFIWFYFYILYDIIMMLATIFLNDYPLEPIIITFLFLNPIDLIRFMCVSIFDISTMMGVGNALINKIFKGYNIIIVMGIILLWVITPVLLGLHYFKKRSL